MSLFDFLKGKKIKDENPPSLINIAGSTEPEPNRVEYADSRSVAEDEREYYRPDDYYTSYSYPGTMMARRVVPFDERKKTSFPSKRGLYVAEILLLHYCDGGNYPKPSGGYPGLWWFEFGIRDVGHALESLENRGFLQWAPLNKCLATLKVGDLKQILEKAGLKTAGKKADLIQRILTEMSEAGVNLPVSARKYELTNLGREELLQNGYVPYMHSNPHRTTEDERFGKTFNVWSINKLFPDGDASDWRRVVGEIEAERFGVNVAMAKQDQKTLEQGAGKRDYTSERSTIRAYLANQKDYINKSIRTPGDGYVEEAKGLDLIRIGKDKEALVQFYISIGKKFDAPALYREAAKLLKKYGMFDEELYVLSEGLKAIPETNRHRPELLKLRDEAQRIIKK